MPKRYYDQLDDGAPGEDDARYASATYNSMTALPGASSSQSQPEASSSSQTHAQSPSAQAQQQQQQQPIQPRPQIPLPGTSMHPMPSIHYDASQFAPVSYSVTPPLSIPAVPAILPPLPSSMVGHSGHAVLPAIPHFPSPPPSSSGAGPSQVPGPVASGSGSGQGQREGAGSSSSNLVQNRPRRRIIPPDAPAHSVMEDDEETYTYTLTDELRASMFREVHGRTLNTMQTVYQLPCDDDETKVRVVFGSI